MLQRNWTPIWHCICILMGCIILIQFKVTYADSNGNPLKFSTNECFLTEPVYGHKFDFAALHSDLGHLTSSFENDIFEFNLCGNMTRKCGDHANVTACIKRKNQKEYVLGTQHELQYDNGKMSFKFLNGETCPYGKPGEKFQLHINLGCDYTLDAKQSQVTSYPSDACSFYINYETPLACLPEPDNVKTNTCNVRDPKSQHTYDLMSLSDSNYRTIDRHGNAFIINVCKPVLYGINAMCPPGSSICFQNLTEIDYKKKFKDYGTVVSQPILENNELKIRQLSPTKCNATANYTSTISFYCDKNVKTGHPEYVGAVGCSHQFSFATSLACNENPPCTAITQSSKTIDMSSLKDKAFNLQQDNQNYVVSICSSPGEPCMENDGVCISGSQSTSLGKFNSNLLIDPKTGTPYVLYDNGSPCTKSNSNQITQWSTRIEFVCGRKINDTNGAAAAAGGGNSAGNGISDGPKIIENSNCQLLIQYQTELACQEQISCKTKAGAELVDLTPLINSMDNYEAIIDSSSSVTEQQVPKSSKIFLNVCRPLVPKYALGCPGGSAGCIGKIDKNTGKLEEEQSLGFPLASLTAYNRTNAILRYFLGSTCPEDKSEKLSSSIELNCDMTAGRGVPKLRAIIDCDYQFSWATNVICPPHTCDFNEDTCEIKNHEINVSYNLKTAPFAKDGKIKVQKDKDEFTLDLCDSHHKAVTDYSQGLVNLFFTAKGTCDLYDDGNINVQMRLICSNENERTLIFNECNLVYVQKTPDICKFLGLSLSNGSGSIATTPSSDTNKQSTTATTTLTPLRPGNNHPAERTSSIGTILAFILSVTFFVVCLGMFAFSPERRNSVSRMFRRSTSSVLYSRVHNSEEGNLLLNANGDIADSDDDDMLL